MPINVDGKPLREELDFSKQEFYRLMDTSKEFPTTAQLTPFEIQEAYEQAAAEGVTDPSKGKFEAALAEASKR